MDIETLQSKGLSFSVIPAGSDFGDKALEGVCTLECPKAHHMFFIKEKKYMDKLEEVMKDQDYLEVLRTMTGVFSSKLWSSLEESKKTEISKTLTQVLTSPKIDLDICKTSSYFYERVSSERNDFVDGRQMGTAKVHPSSELAQNVFVGKNVQIQANVTIYPGVVIMSDSVVEEGSIIFPNVTIYPSVKIGKNCRIHSQATIGADGFGYHFDSGVHQKVWHFGGVEIGDDVEIGANSCVDGGTFTPTLIGEGAKLDNHVQIGHNCTIGRGVIICGHVAIGGSTQIGDYVVFGGKSGTGHGLSIGAMSEVAGGALVNCDWPEKTRLGGHPARPLKEWMRGIAYIRKESLK